MHLGIARSAMGSDDIFARLSSAAWCTVMNVADLKFRDQLPRSRPRAREKIVRKPITRISLGALLISLWSLTAAQAADYPTRPVTLITAFTPGGPSDLIARIVGQKLAEILRQPFVVDGRPGGGGNIAAEYVARATPD